MKRAASPFFELFLSCRQQSSVLKAALPVRAGAQVGVQPLGRPAELVGHAVNAPHSVWARQHDQPLHIGRRAFLLLRALSLTGCMRVPWWLGHRQPVE